MAINRPAIVAIGLVTAVAGPAQAQERSGVRVAETVEIAPFRLMSVEGYVEGSHWSDTDRLSTPTGAGSESTLANTTGKVFVMTHSYVYHPSLLLLDLGAGQVLFRNRFSSDGVSGATTQSTYDLDTRATFLRDKPYRGSLYYQRLNDRQAVGPTQSMLTRNTRYGVDFSLLPPVSPVPMHLNVFRTQSKGSGADQVIDEVRDEVDFRAERAWGETGYTSLRYQGMRADSNSGSLSLPIQGTVSRTQRADLDNRVALGEGKRDTLTNALSFYSIRFNNQLATIVDDDLYRFDLYYRGQPSDTLETRLRYQFDGADRRAQSGQGAESWSRQYTVGAGASWHAMPALNLNFEAFGSVNDGSAFHSNITNIDLSANYRHALEVGELVVGGSMLGAWRDQVARSPTAEVIGERRTLSGLTWVALRQNLVRIDTVVVQNATRTQTYVEGIDYALRVIGLTTEIQRLAAGAILDGQEVLVDYDYDTGGTFAMREWGRTFDISWRVMQRFNLYGRYVGRSVVLTSGVPTAPLNPGHEVTFGAQADLPYELWGEQMTAGALVEWADRREQVSPNRRTLYEAYVESSVPLIARSGLRLGARQQRTEYGLTPLQDVTQRTITLRFWSRFRSGLTIYADAMVTRDSGALTMDREYQQASLKAQWRIRQLLMTLRIDATRQLQAGTQRTGTRAEFDLRRDF